MCHMPPGTQAGDNRQAEHCALPHPLLPGAARSTHSLSLTFAVSGTALRNGSSGKRQQLAEVRSQAAFGRAAEPPALAR